MARIEKSPVIEGFVENIPCKMLVDTGANVTIVHPKIWAKIRKPSSRQTADSRKILLKTANGDRIPVIGEEDLELRIGDFSKKHRVLIATVVDDCILGIEFLRSVGCIVDLSSNMLHIGDVEEVPLHCRNVQVEQLQVVAPRNITVPPFREFVTPIQVKVVEDSSYMFEPDKSLSWNKTIVLARTLIQNSTLPLRILNVSDHPVTIKKGTPLGVMEPVLAIRKLERDTVKQEEDRRQLSEAMQELFDRSCEHLTSVQKIEVAKLLKEFQTVFAKDSFDLGRTHLVRHKIDIGDARPIKQPPRRMPISQIDEVHELIEDMHKRGVIEPSTSPWASPIVLVKKKDGSTRFCVDYRKLNEITKKDSYPLPRIDDTLDAVGNSTWFSTLDLQSGYWQVELDEKDKEKTAFTSCAGLWQFTVMPFGLCNAPGTFERLMERVLQGLSWKTALIYLDDVIVHGKDFQQELSRLRQVFYRLKEANLKLNPRKCHLFQRKVKYLGHVLSAEGIQTDPEKLDAVRNWKIPSDVHELRSFLGLCSYYRRFVKDFSIIAKPLFVLTEHNTNFQWTKDCQKAFDQLKVALTSSPILAHPTENGTFYLDTDASYYGIGAVLSQEQDGAERVIGYYSKTLHKAQKNWCVTRKELYAVVKAIENFHNLLYGRKFVVRTDHSALQWLMKFKNPEGQVARWLEHLQTYDFDIRHRPGKYHGNADSLSRRPCNIDCKNCCKQEQRELLVNLTRVEEFQFDGVTFSEEEFQKVQNEDSILKSLLNWLKEGKRPSFDETSAMDPVLKGYLAQWNSLKLKDGILYRIWESTDGKQSVEKLILPRKLRKEVMRQLHDGNSGGHFGIKKTMQKIKARFYWIGCREDVENYCNTCDICNSRKGPNIRQRNKMQQYNVGSPFERIGIDILGPLPATERGNRYLVVVMDYFTKWPEVFPVPNQEAETVAAGLMENVISRFGVPMEIHSDQGRNFESEVFQCLMKVLGITKTRTTALHPQSDGMVERFNKTILDYLSKFIDDHQSDWDKLINLCMLAYRTAVNETTQISPAKMMFGRELRLPVDLVVGQPPEQGERRLPEWVSNLQDVLWDLHDAARKQIQSSSDRMKARYDLRARGPKFAEGDNVWFYNPKRRKGKCPKLQRDWEGPYEVIKCLNDVVFRIRKGLNGKPKVVHGDRLWPYRNRNTVFSEDVEP